jgi:hypothetical protein
VAQERGRSANGTDVRIAESSPWPSIFKRQCEKGQTFAAKSKLDAAYRSEFGKASKHHTNRGANRFIWMEAHLAVSPSDEADPSRFVANATK